MPTRREVLRTGAAFAAIPGLMAGAIRRLTAAPAQAAGPLRIARFQAEVTPPEGHSLCGGWIKPVVAVDDPLRCLGFVILGAGKPIVVCAVDWTGLLNSAHLRWRQAMAAAVSTTPDRVAVQCVHQHNAPFACLDTQALVAEQGDLPAVLDTKFFDDCLTRVAAAAKGSLAQAQPLTHIGRSQAKVEQVASNRRILDDQGNLIDWRGSSSKNPRHHELPEGQIDPYLKTVAFYSNDTPVVACHYYACHPMSYYGDGRVTSDYVGLARQRYQDEHRECLQIYFTGCAGNIAAGKYNDGSPQARVRLTERIYQAMVASGQELAPAPIRSMAWRTHPVLPKPNPKFQAEQLAAAIANPNNRVVARSRPAFTLAWLNRCAAEGPPIILSSLAINEISLLHLPAESFLEYQLFAQQQQPERFVATAAYGDGGPWYIPTADAYPQGGYEVSVAFCDPAVEAALQTGIRQVKP